MMDDSKREEARARARVEAWDEWSRDIDFPPGTLEGTRARMHFMGGFNAALDAALTPPADPTDDEREALVAILVNNRQAIAGSMHQYVDSETTADLVLASGFRRPTPATREQVVRELVNAEVIVNDGDGQWEQPMRKEAERIADTLLSRFTITPKDDTA